MISSYSQNNYAEVFYAIVTGFRPANAVELGVLHGYSTIAIGQALRRNSVMPGIQAHLDAYDLFGDYPYKHGMIEDVRDEILECSLESFVTVHTGDAFHVHKNYMDNSLYFLHIDISNTGEIVRKIMELWDSKIVIGGIILFEGGTEERDKVEWMVKYNKEPIKPEIEKNPIIEARYIFGTYLKFPGLTMLLKKR